jgi:hypothetical protein
MFAPGLGADGIESESELLELESKYLSENFLKGLLLITRASARASAGFED